MNLRSSWFTRYCHDALAWEYDLRHHRLAPGELEWYLKYARLTGGPILELACGTGRLLIPIAQAGYRIHGLDLSGAMLRLLKMKMCRLHPDVRRRIKLYQGDMLRFSPPIRYPLAILAYNSLQELETPAECSSLFKRVQGYLRDGGYLLLMVTRAYRDRYRDGKDYLVDWFDAPAADVESGLSVGSSILSRLDVKGNRIVLRESFLIRRDGSREEKVEVTHYIPLLSASEYGFLLEKAGFAVRGYSGYDEQPEDGRSQVLCFAAEKASHLPGRSVSQEGQNREARYDPTHGEPL
jgi:SAM-dependent methyltransferase